MTKPNWEQIRNEWETSDITFKALAEKYGLKDSTVRSRKSREKWQRNKSATQHKNVATKKKNVSAKKKNREPKKEPVIKNDDLTDKQRLFCVYYTKYWNVTKAYQKAYDCDYHSARANGARLIANDSIKQEIKRIKQDIANGIMLDATAILQKYIDIAFADITDYVEFGSTEVGSDEFKEELTGVDQSYTYSYVNLKDSSEIDGTILTEVKRGKDGISVKLADKMKALEMLSKYFDLLSDNDKKRLQEEKLKAETAKVRAEAEKIAKEQEGESPPQITIVDEWSDESE